METDLIVIGWIALHSSDGYIAVFVETVWDPLSTRETKNLVRQIVKLVATYPTLTSDSKNSKVPFVFELNEQSCLNY